MQTVPRPAARKLRLRDFQIKDSAATSEEIDHLELPQMQFSDRSNTSNSSGLVSTR